MDGGAQSFYFKPELAPLVVVGRQSPGSPAFWWARHSVQRAPLSTNGEQVGDYHPKFEGGKVVPAVVMPPQAYRELQGKQTNKPPPEGQGTEIALWCGSPALQVNPSACACREAVALNARGFVRARRMGFGRRPCELAVAWHMKEPQGT